MPLQPYRNVGQVDPQNMGIGLVQNIEQSKLNQTRNALADLQLQETQSPAATKVREAARQGALDEATLKSITAGAIEMYPYVKSGNDEALRGAVDRRYNSLLQSGRDVSQTGEIRDMLYSGDQAQIDQAKAIIEAVATNSGDGEKVGTTQMQNAAAAGLIPGTDEYKAAVLPRPVAAPQDPERVRLARAAGLVPGTQEYNDFVLGKGGEGGESANAEKIRLAADVIFRRRSDPNDPAYTPGFTQQDAQDEATERALLDKGIKVLESGRGFGIDPLASTENVTDLPIKSSLPEVPQPAMTAMDVSDDVAGPIAVTARMGEKFLSMLGLQADTKLSEQRRFVLGLLPDIIRSRSTNPGKTSLVERKLILEQLGIEPGFFTGASEFEGNIRALDSLLEFSENADTALLASTGISAALRDKTTQRLITTKNTRAQLGTMGSGDETSRDMAFDENGNRIQ